MTYLLISNDGEIENGALSLLGASTKDSDTQIGKFGSGFKYAIATLLRHDVELRIFSGLREIPLTIKTENFRDRTFDVIYIDGQRTSLTTSTGPEWKVRDAVREIWSNALDEGGAKYLPSAAAVPESGRTVVAVEMTAEVARMVTQWHLYFLSGKTPLAHSWRGKIYAQNTTNYFRRGVWICEDRENEPILSYDFDDIELPESRKIKSSSVGYWINCLLEACDSVEVFERILECRDKNKAEWLALSSWGLTTGTAGQRAMHEAFFKQWEFIGNEKNREKIMKIAGLRKVLWCEGAVLSALRACKLPQIEHEVDFSDAYEIGDWPIGTMDRLDETMARLKQVGIDMTKFQMKYVVMKQHSEIIAFADMKKRICYITSRAFSAKPEMLMKALIEEWTHLEHDAIDCSVGQQHIYLDLIVNLIKKVK